MKPLYFAVETITFCLISGSFMIFYYYLEKRHKRSIVMKRLFASSKKAAKYEKKRMETNLKNSLISLGVFAKPKNAAETEDLKQILGYAGFRSKNAVVIFFGIKLALALLSGFLYMILLILSGNLNGRSIIFVFFPVAIGYYLPGLLLKHKVTARHRQIFKELPNTLDLLLICMEAGLSFDMALYRVSGELSSVAPLLSKEFGRYFLEIKGGLPRMQVLKNLADRNGEKNLTSVVNVLVQSIYFGTDIAEAIEIYSDSLRTERRQIAEERGAKISTKLAFPTVLLILPALMLVMLGPAAINLIERMN